MKESVSSGSHDGHFTLPCKKNFWALLENDDEEVAVVSVVGQSNFEDGCDKTSPLSFLLGRNISSCSNVEPLHIDDSLVHLEGWYDRSQHIIFLHLVGAQDIAFLTSGIPAVEAVFQEKGDLLANSALDQQYIRALMLVFSLSHLVLWCQASHQLDTTVITTLRTLNNIRLEVLPHLTSALLRVPGTGRTWASSGRLCCPRLLLLFSSANLDADQLARELSAEANTANSTPCPETVLRTVERALEDQLYRLLRRTWTITNNSAHSIVALPSNQQYVYMLSPHQLLQPTEERAANALLQLCQQEFTVDRVNHGLSSCGLSAQDNVSRIHDGMMPGGSSRKKKWPLLDMVATHLLAEKVTDVTANTEHRFSNFLRHHINLTLAGGFDDNVGRTSSAPVFVLPKAKTWFAAATRLYHFFVTPEKDSQCPSDAVHTLTVESPQVQLLRNLCRQAQETALAHYKDGLPQHYPRHLHLTKLQESLFLYDDRASGGPFLAKFRQRLVEQCRAVWTDGRQGCEQLSLTGHSCQHGRLDHPTLRQGDDENVLAHSFGVSFHKFCNCGYRSAKLADSCILRSLNADFYVEQCELCCGVLECYLFPSLETGSLTVHHEAQELMDEEVYDEGSVCGEAQESGNTVSGLTTATIERLQPRERSTSELSGLCFSPIAAEDAPQQRWTSSQPSEYSGSQFDHSSSPSPAPASDEGVNAVDQLRTRLSNTFLTDGSDEDKLSSDLDVEGVSQLRPLGDKEDQSEDNGTRSVHSNKKSAPSFGRLHLQQKHPLEQHSDDDGEESQQQQNTFKIEPMLCSASPPGFLPQYSSWSCVCVGPSSLYSHNIGIIDQPGYIAGSNFLLPWDIKVKLNNKNDWCPVTDSHSKKGKGKINLGPDEFCVKVFLGLEYECIQGHRFLMSSPSTVLMSPSGQPLISAHSIASSAMPLYHKCLCSDGRSKEMFLGQLMRIHVITPKAPVSVQLSPQVQPGPAPCPRYFPQPQSAPGIKLSAAMYWVLRLPNIYVSDTGPYYPPDPSQHVGVENGCLLPGCFSITELSMEK